MPGGSVVSPTAVPAGARGAGLADLTPTFQPPSATLVPPGGPPPPPLSRSAAVLIPAGCKTLQFYRTAPPPAVKRCKRLQLQFYGRAASPPSCKALQKLAAAVLQPSCVPTSCKTAFYSELRAHPAVKRCKSLQPQFYSRAAFPPNCKALQKLAVAVYSRAAFPPAVKPRGFTAGLRPHQAVGRCCFTAHLRSHPLLAGAVASDA